MSSHVQLWYCLLDRLLPKENNFVRSSEEAEGYQGAGKGVRSRGAEEGGKETYNYAELREVYEANNTISLVFSIGALV